MATNQYFNHHGTNTPENRLIENLMIESIKTYGIDVYYLPRTLNNEDTLLGEDASSSFNSAHTIEMYIKNVEGFEGEGDFIAKWGLQIKDQITFTVAKRIFQQHRHYFKYCLWKMKLYFIRPGNCNLMICYVKCLPILIKNLILVLIL